MLSCLFLSTLCLLLGKYLSFLCVLSSLCPLLIFCSPVCSSLLCIFLFYFLLFLSINLCSWSPVSLFFLSVGGIYTLCHLTSLFSYFPVCSSLLSVSSMFPFFTLCLLPLYFLTIHSVFLCSVSCLFIFCCFPVCSSQISVACLFIFQLSSLFLSTMSLAYLFSFRLSAPLSTLSLTFYFLAFLFVPLHSLSPASFFS